MSALDQAQEIKTRLAAADEPLLVERAQAGDRAIFGALYARHHEGVRRYVASQLRTTPDDVDDVVSETFLAALQRIGTYRGDGGAQFRTWLVGIARFRVLTHRRRRARRPEVELVERWPGWGIVDPTVPAPDATAIARLELAGLAAALSPRRLEALLLQHWSGLPCAAVARAMGMSEFSVWSLTREARSSLRRADVDGCIRTEQPCACGCGRALPPNRHPTQRYATRACQDRAWSSRRGEVQQRWLDGDVEQDPAVGRVLAVIVGAGPGGVTRKDLNRRVRLLSGRLGRIVDLLTNQGRIQGHTAREPHSDHPVTRYFAPVELREVA